MHRRIHEPLRAEKRPRDRRARRLDGMVLTTLGNASIGHEFYEVSFVHRPAEVVTFHRVYAKMGDELALFFRFDPGRDDIDPGFLGIGAEPGERGSVAGGA